MPGDNGASAAPGEQAGPDGRWYKGMPSPNPQGRPPKIRSLTAALEGIADKDVLAQRVWDIATGKLTSNVAIQLEAMKYIDARIEGNPVQAMRHQTDGTIMPLIFLHPGREPAASSTQPDSDRSDDRGSL